MTELNNYGNRDVKKTCRICLGLTQDTYPMSHNEKVLYFSLIGKMPQNDWNICICLICRWMLSKCIKFVEQCRKANELFEQYIDVDSKSFICIPQLTSSHNFITIRNTSFISATVNAKRKENNSTAKTETNCETNFMITGTDGCPNTNYVVSSDTHLDDEINDGFNSFDGLNDDDLPLITLRTDRKGKTRKKKKKYKNDENSLVEYDDKIKEELSIQDNCTKKVKLKKKNKKEVREGFSSKMVQETDEYIVIKLSKEQVLQELEERSKSEEYLRSPYKCEKCVKWFNFEDVLKKHMVKHSTENGHLKCDMCSQYCPSAVSLRGHIKSHTTRYQCKICSDVRISRQHLLEHHGLRHSGAVAKYTCDYCSYTTNKRTVIQRHVKVHTDKGRHECTQCGKQFKTVLSLRVHSMRHDKSRELRCPHCNKKFIYPSLLQKHVRAVHVKKEYYYCVECDVRFISPETMRLHFIKTKRHRDPASDNVKSFNDTTRYPCEECGRLYSTRPALRSHRRKHKQMADPKTQDRQISRENAENSENC